MLVLRKKRMERDALQGSSTYKPCFSRAVFAFMALTNIIYQYGMDQAYLRFAKEKTNKELFATPLIAVFTSGIFIRLVINYKKKNGFVEEEIIWEENDFE